jgi:hypothetical protein
MEISPSDDANNKKNNTPDEAHKNEIRTPYNANKSKTSGSQKRKHGCPRKVQPPEPTNPVIDQFKTDTIAGVLEGRTRRKTNPGPHKSSPYKEP